MNELITTYPSPPELRHALVSYLDELLCSSLPDHPRGIQLACGRIVSSAMSDEQLIDGIKAANTKFLSHATSSNKEEMLQAYSHFVWEQYHMVKDDALVR